MIVPKNANANNSDNAIIALDSNAILEKYGIAKKCDVWFDALLAENKKLNLVSRETTREDLKRLSAESVLPLEYSQQSSFALHLDIGSGGGFPAFPLMLTDRIKRTTMVERTQKKALALRRILGAMHMEAGIIAQTFEEANLEPSYELITIRLVALTPKLLVPIVSHLAIGGIFIYYAAPPPLPPAMGLQVKTVRYSSGPSSPVKELAIITKNR
ncbi:MAG: RsmG family class I SAM-dependent methyltransferase [Candidatus Zixiibacteriota bacterium]